MASIRPAHAANLHDDLRHRCAWLARKIEQKRKERDAVEAIVKLGGSVTYDYEKVRGAKPPGPDWLRKFLGENFFSEVEGVTISGNAVLTDAEGPTSSG